MKVSWGKLIKTSGLDLTLIIVQAFQTIAIEKIIERNSVNFCKLPIQTHKNSPIIKYSTLLNCPLQQRKKGYLIKFQNQTH